MARTPSALGDGGEPAHPIPQQDEDHGRRLTAYLSFVAKLAQAMSEVIRGPRAGLGTHASGGGLASAYERQIAQFATTAPEKGIGEARTILSPAQAADRHAGSAIMRQHGYADPSSG